MSNWKNVLWMFEGYCTGQGSHILLPPPRRCTSSVWSSEPPFHTCYSSVSMCTLSVIVRWTWGQCPEHFQLTRCISGSSPVANQVHWISTDANWSITRQGTHEFWTKRMPAHNYHTSSGRLFLVESTFSRIERTWPDKERIRRMSNRQETHADGDKQIDNVVLCQMSVNAIP